MQSPGYRALIVDDEPAIRHATARALTEEGFTCDHAADGKVAVEQVDANSYDVIVTDLKMPEMNGHALAVHLLNRAANAPKIVVQTGIIEARLARDLFSRGVADIVYKPCDQRLMAMKIKRMVDSTRRVAPEGDGCSQAPGAGIAAGPAGHGPELTMQDIDRRLDQVSRVLPVSQAAIDVFQMVSADTCNAGEIGRAIQRDPALAVEVLRIANTAHYNPAGKKIASLEEAVARIGQRRIAELAIATSALTAITAVTLPWLDVDLTWRKSLAAGVAAELLVEQGKHERIEHGLVLCAIMHPVGQVVIGTLFPDLYPTLLDLCRQKGTSLFEEEAEVLPAHHTRIMSKLLKLWNIPIDVYLPLGFLHDDWAAVARLGEPLRTRIELIRTAMVIGNIAVGRWQPWDIVDCPSGRMLHRLNICAVAPIIDETRERTEQLLRFRRDAEDVADDVATESSDQHEVSYLSFTEQSMDLLHHLLLSFGLYSTRIEDSSDCRPDVVNCLDLPPHAGKLLANVGKCGVVVAERNQAIDVPAAANGLIRLAASHAAFRRAIQVDRHDSADCQLATADV